MDGNIEWLTPAILPEQQAMVENRALRTLRRADFLAQERRALSLRFLPNGLPNLPLVAIIEEFRSGKLLGVMESKRNEISFTLMQAFSDS